MFKNDYRKQVWMVQKRDTELEAQNKIEAGYPELVERDWKDVLVKPTWGKRASWHANDIKSKFTETRIVKVA